MYIGYRSSQEKQANPNPKRLIFYRGMTFVIFAQLRLTRYLDGVSEGQFQQVLDIGVCPDSFVTHDSSYVPDF